MVHGDRAGKGAAAARPPSSRRASTPPIEEGFERGNSSSATEDDVPIEKVVSKGGGALETTLRPLREAAALRGGKGGVESGDGVGLGSGSGQLGGSEGALWCRLGCIQPSPFI